MSSLLQKILLQQQAAVKLLLGVLVISAAIFVTVAAEVPNSGCNRTCGLLEIPYPFGTSEGCYLDSSFLITCNSSSTSGTSTPTPFLRVSDTKVLNISLMHGELRVSSSVASDCPLKSDYNSSNSYASLALRAFPISYTKNVFTAIGCDTLALMGSSKSLEKNYSTTGCLSLCDSMDGMVNDSCSGVGCCQTPIPDGIKDFIVSVGSLYNHSNIGQLGTRHAKMPRRMLQDTHVRQQIVNVTIPQTVLGIAVTAPQAMKETHISLMVAKILMSVKL